jgi:hypothetical protein
VRFEPPTGQRHKGAVISVGSPNTIEREQMEQAIRSMNDYYVPAYRHAAGPMAQSVERRSANALVTWLREKGLKAFNSRDAYRSDGVLTGLVPEKDRPRIMDEACLLLMDAGLMWPSAWNTNPELNAGAGLAGGGKVPKDFDVHPCADNPAIRVFGFESIVADIPDIRDNREKGD